MKYKRSTKRIADGEAEMTNAKKYKGDKMKAYKGFNKDMTCRGFHYEEGKEYEISGDVKCCENGFHACEDPLDCFTCYATGGSVYHEVEQSGEISRNNDGESKVASSKIKIGARLDIAKIVNLHFDFVKSRTTFENTDPKQASAGAYGAASAGWRGAASAGAYGAASAGEQGAASAGWRGAASAGEQGAASAGEQGAASAGEQGAASAGAYGAASAGAYGAASAGAYGAASAGWRGAASAGEQGAASAGEQGAASAGAYGAASAGAYGAASAGAYGAASAGWRGAAVSKGSADVGENGIACVRGNGCKVKGGIGAILVIAEENEYDNDIKEWQAFVVDGQKIKADTYYTLTHGEIVEADND